MTVKGNHPLAEILAKKLFSLESVPIKEQHRMLNRAIKAGVEYHKAEIKKFTEFEHIDKIRIEEGLAEIKKLREALDRIRPWISRITDGILADWQEDLCWDIDLICEEVIEKATGKTQEELKKNRVGGVDESY